MACFAYSFDMEPRYVAVIEMPGGDRLFCSDQHRDEWTGRVGFAETFRALHVAEQIARRHGGRALVWTDVHAFEAVS